MHFPSKLLLTSSYPNPFTSSEIDVPTSHSFASTRDVGVLFYFSLHLPLQPAHTPCQSSDLVGVVSSAFPRPVPFSHPPSFLSRCSVWCSSGNRCDAASFLVILPVSGLVSVTFVCTAASKIIRLQSEPDSSILLAETLQKNFIFSSRGQQTFSVKVPSSSNYFQILGCIVVLATTTVHWESSHKQNVSNGHGRVLTKPFSKVVGHGHRSQIPCAECTPGSSAWQASSAGDTALSTIASLQALPIPTSSSELTVWLTPYYKTHSSLLTILTELKIKIRFR